MLPPIQNKKILKDAKDDAIQKGLPIDYIDFFEDYGLGCIDDFLWILCPLTNNTNLNIYYKTAEILAIFDQNSFDYVEDLMSYIKRNKSYVMAITENGDYIFYSNSFNHERITLIDSRFGMGEAYEMGFIEFIFKLLTKEVISNILPSDFVFEKKFVLFET